MDYYSFFIFSFIPAYAEDAAVKLYPKNPIENEAFGFLVDSFDQYLAVSTLKKMVYIFKYKNGDWNQIDEISPPDDSYNVSKFGTSLSIYETIIAIGGGIYTNGNYRQCIFLYKIQNDSCQLGNVIILSDPNISGNYKVSIELNQNQLIIGLASEDDYIGWTSGFAYIYKCENGHPSYPLKSS